MPVAYKSDTAWRILTEYDNFQMNLIWFDFKFDWISKVIFQHTTTWYVIKV